MTLKMAVWGAMIRVIGQNYLTITYRQNLDAVDLAYQIETSGDLKTWVVYEPAVEDVSTNPIDSSTREVTIRMPADQNRGFLRVIPQTK